MVPSWEKWIRIEAHSISSWRAKRGRIHERKLAKATKELNRITTEITRHADLQKNLEKVRALRKQVVQANRATTGDYYTTGEIANETGYHRRHIARLAQNIPGAIYSGKRWVFPKSEELHLWIRNSIGVRVAAVRAARAEHRLNKRGNRTRTISGELNKLVLFLKKLTRNRPISEWRFEEVSAFQDDAEPLAEAYMQAQNRLEEIELSNGS